MKQISKIIVLAVFLHAVSALAWLWPSPTPDPEKERLQEQVQQQRRSTGDWQIVAFVLGIGCVITLVAGAAIGSKVRRAANERGQ